MRLTADYHTHTVFSHGKGSVEDNVKAAIEGGLKTVGITDHSVSHLLYGIRKNSLDDYLKSIKNAKEKYADRIEVKSGIELNLVGLDGSIDLPFGFSFDIVILGYHKAAICKSFDTAWTFFNKRDIERITQSYMLAVQKQKIDIISHPGYGVPVDYTRLAKACNDYGTLFEINNKHTDLKPEDLKIDAKFVVSSDAHDPRDVGRAGHALALIKSAGLDIKKIVNVEED